MTDANLAPGESTIGNARRYYLFAARSAVLENLGLDSDLYGAQQREPGTPLPTDFPFRDTLAAAHYTTVEDLTGAGTKELLNDARLSHKQAEAVIAALAAL